MFSLEVFVVFWQVDILNKIDIHDDIPGQSLNIVPSELAFNGPKFS